MKDILVSVVIPVYKTEKTLPLTMKSVFDQDYPYLEIILVDDGSPDNCGKICDDYAKNHTNVRVIHQKNQGLGLARNAGFKQAEGKYVAFLDSDDCFDGSRAISILAAEAEKKQADIVVGSFRRFNDNMISGVNHHHLREGEYTKTVDFRFKGFYMYGHLAYAWGKLYRCEFLKKNNLLHKAYSFTQDKAYNIACCAYEPVYAFVDESVCMYRINENSVTFKYKKNFIPVWTDIAEDFVQFLKERNIKKSYGDLTDFHIFFGVFFLVKQELQHNKRIFAAARALKDYCCLPVSKKSIRELAEGKYLRSIEPFLWKTVILAASFLLYIRSYRLITLGIYILLKFEADSKITKKRYKKQ